MAKKNPSPILHPPSSPAQPGIRDAEGVARAWGLSIYDNRKQRLAQLAAVKTVMERADFPKPVKNKGGAFFDRAAVTQYGLAHIVADGKGRGFEWREKAEDRGLKIEDGKGGKSPRKPSSILHHPSSSELPAQSAPAGDGQLFAAPGESFEALLVVWKDKVVNPERWIESPIQQWQLKEVKKRWPELFEFGNKPATEDSENIEGGDRGVANWIRNNYQGRLTRLPSHTDIKNWRNSDYLPGGCKEPFPSDEAKNGRFKTARVRGWVEKYLLKAEIGQELNIPQDYRQAQEKLDYERSAEEYRVWQQANSDKYISVEQADADAVGLLQRHHSFTRRSAEKLFKTGVVDKLRKLAAFTEEQLTVIGEACVATGKEVVSAIEDNCQTAEGLTADKTG